MNAPVVAAGDVLGPVGLVVGATIADAAARTGTDLAAVRGPLLAPGVGAQGAGAAELAAVFGDARRQVLASSSRGVLRAGPGADALRAAAAGRPRTRRLRRCAAEPRTPGPGRHPRGGRPGRRRARCGPVPDCAHDLPRRDDGPSHARCRSTSGAAAAGRRAGRAGRAGHLERAGRGRSGGAGRFRRAAADRGAAAHGEPVPADPRGPDGARRPGRADRRGPARRGRARARRRGRRPGRRARAAPRHGPDAGPGRRGAGSGASADPAALVAGLLAADDPAAVARRLMHGVYATFVTDPGIRETVGRVLADVAAADGASVVHCSAGKDRTGWVVALVQYVAGVPEQERMAEYLASAAAAEGLAALVPRCRGCRPRRSRRSSPSSPRTWRARGSSRCASTGASTTTSWRAA